MRVKSYLAVISTATVCSFVAGALPGYAQADAEEQYTDGLHEPAITEITDPENSRDWFPGNDAVTINVPGTDHLTFDNRTKPLIG